jgi:hypothetical protein
VRWCQTGDHTHHKMFLVKWEMSGKWVYILTHELVWHLTQFYV